MFLAYQLAGCVLFCTSAVIFSTKTFPALIREYWEGKPRRSVPIFGQLARYKELCMRDGKTLLWWRLQVVLNWVLLPWLVGGVVLMLCDAV